MTAKRSKIPRVAEIVSLAAALVLVLLIIILASRSRNGLRTGSEQVQITQQLLEGTDTLLSALKDAETGQRGFLLTGEDQYLEPYLQAMKRKSDSRYGHRSRDLSAHRRPPRRSDLGRVPGWPRRHVPLHAARRGCAHSITSAIQKAYA